MKENLEEFVRKNRASFDDREPSDKLWDRISDGLGLHNVRFWNSMGFWRAAAVLLLSLSIYLLVPRFSGNAGDSRQRDLALKEFTDVEEFYVQQISQKTELIQEFKRNEGLNGFTHDFQQLEAMYMVLREEMKTRPSQQVKDALVLNLLVRIDLLNQQLHKLEQGEYQEEPQQPKKESKNA